MKYLIWLSVFFSLSSLAQRNVGPSLVQSNGSTHLLVNGKPFLILGGELGNSSSSSNEYMRWIWPKLQSMKLNTALVPVYWELMEPEEGKFDFTLVDSLIINARKHQIKLVPLWFGTWKNSMSCYVPSWIKRNPQRFQRTLDSSGRSIEILSAFHTAILEADKKAFAALMAHIKKIDAQQQTVIMVQVENEIGMLTQARETTAQANVAYQANVPAALTGYMQQHKASLVPEFSRLWQQQGNPVSGNWEQLFGKSIATEEIFQAWYYAVFANEVATAGKAAYDIPMYVNAALITKGKKPGQYPSAGPLPQVMDVWKAAAPAIDILAPDFYNPDTEYWCNLFTRKNNPLFIPEMRLEPSCAAKVFFTIGHYNSIGFSPFSIENADPHQAKPLTQSYELLQQLAPVLTNATLKKEGVLFDKVHQQQHIRLGDFNISLKHDLSLGWNPEAKDSLWEQTGALIIQMAPDEYLVAGTGVVCTFESVNAALVTNIDRIDEGRFVNGKWMPGRRLNGDEDHQGRHLRIPFGKWDMQWVKLYTAP